MNDVVDMRDAFFDQLYHYISQDKDVVILTADHGAFGLKKIEEDFPDQYLNVGIAEQALISIAAGLAKCGKKVYVYAINNFVSLRVLEQINVDLCAMGLDVNIIGVGAGFTYSTDGPTHHGVQDLSVMINLPGLRIYNVTDDVNTKKLVDISYTDTGPKYFRIEKGRLPRLYNEDDDISTGYKRLSEGKYSACLLSTGFITHTAANVLAELQEEGISISHMDIFSIKPLPELAIIDICKNRKVITLEENIKSGGFGEKISVILKHSNHTEDILNLAIDDCYYFKFGDRDSLHIETGLDKKTLITKIKNFI